MTDFVSFCRALGIVIDHLPPVGKWVRFKTESHPHRKNGAVKFLGTVGFAQDHSTMAEPAVWFPGAEIRIDHAALAKQRQKAANELAEQRAAAAKKAGWILDQCRRERHAYLDGKGFPDEMGMVWHRSETDNLLVIPMRVGMELVGVQTINRDGEKKFLFGQRTGGAEYLIDNKGRNYYCEGYATGLSLRAVLHALKVRYRIHITFSAHNLTTMAKESVDAIVIADNDCSGTGEEAAKASMRPYILPPTVGHDLNDWHRAEGLFRLSQAVRKRLAEIN